MKTQLLLPNKYKKLGWALLIPALLLGIVAHANGFEWLKLEAWVPAIIDEELLGSKTYFSLIHTNVTNTLIGILFIAGGLLVSFSREKNEDEFISSLRQSSLLWSVLVNYLLLAFAFLFIYGVAFLQVMLYNMFTTLVIYLVRFNYVLYRNNKASA
jgi:hypothetical protein